MNMEPWGHSALIDLFGCEKEILVSKSTIAHFLFMLCREIEMKSHGMPRVERFGYGDIEGVSGFLFIETSNIAIHCDEKDDRVFITIESCKPFDEEKARQFSIKEFKAQNSTLRVLKRGLYESAGVHKEVGSGA